MWLMPQCRGLPYRKYFSPFLFFFHYYRLWCRFADWCGLIDVWVFLQISTCSGIDLNIFSVFLFSCEYEGLIFDTLTIFFFAKYSIDFFLSFHYWFPFSDFSPWGLRFFDSMYFHWFSISRKYLISSVDVRGLLRRFLLFSGRPDFRHFPSISSSFFSWGRRCRRKCVGRRRGG